MSAEKSDRYMLLSVALPADEELENAMENASYLLEKRSGFVASSDYAEEWRKRRIFMYLQQVPVL